MNLNLFQSKLTKDAQGAVANVNLSHAFASTCVDFSLNTWSVSAEFMMNQSFASISEAPIYLYDEFEGGDFDDSEDDEWFDDEEFEGDEFEDAELDFDDEDFADDIEDEGWDDEDDWSDDEEFADDDDDI